MEGSKAQRNCSGALRRSKVVSENASRTHCSQVFENHINSLVYGTTTNWIAVSRWVGLPYYEGQQRMVRATFPRIRDAVKDLLENQMDGPTTRS
jgi:hypothetical protein